MAQLIEWLLRVAYCMSLLDHVLSLEEDPVITTKLGKLLGNIMSTSGKGREFLAFRGIPYARPPLNAQRFKLPIPIDPWDGILNATADGPRCMQMTTSLLSGGSYGDEDCLNLNVYVPQSTSKGLRNKQYPVMVFIHGGAFDSGCGSDYGPQEFMDTNAVILVTINYRVGIFGFLSTEDEISPGNYGLWDQNLALKWVQENIDSFGGDKTRVTIMGESAGAGSVTLHLLSPNSKGLFAGAICESGTAVSDRTLQLHPLVHAKQLAKNLHCPTHSNAEMVKCLKKIPAKDLLLNGSYMNKTSFPFRFWPVIDKDFGGSVFIHGSPNELLRNSKHNVVPVISGANRDEGIFYYLKEFLVSKLTIENDGLFSVANLKSLAPTLAPHIMADKENGPTIFNRIVDEYFKEVDQTNEKQVILKISQFVTDSKMNVYVDYTNKMLAEHGSSVFVYKLTHRGKSSLLDLMPIGESTNRLLTDLNIVVHADELQYLYQCGFFKSSYLENKDRKMSDIILNLWTSFAQTGVPSLNELSEEIGSLEWPSITKEKYSYLNLSLNPHMVDGQLNSKPYLWDVLESFSTRHRQSTFEKSEL